MHIETESIRINVNGEERDVASGAALPDLLRDLDIDPDAARGVAVALNDAVVRRSNWGAVVLAEGDRVEVITARQGG